MVLSKNLASTASNLSRVFRLAQRVSDGCVRPVLLARPKQNRAFGKNETSVVRQNNSHSCTHGKISISSHHDSCWQSGPAKSLEKAQTNLIIWDDASVAMKTLSLCLLGLLASAWAHVDHPKFRRVQEGRKINNEYIVILKDGYTMDDLALILSGANLRTMNVYGNVVNGFSVRLPESALEIILNDPAVKYVEEVSLYSVRVVVQSER